MQLDIRDVLTKHNLRVTKPRRLVFELLSEANTPLSLTEIIQACPTVDRVSIYRIIETFDHIGIITTVPHGWKSRYELAEPFKSHHHHLHCLQCGRSIEIHSDNVESIIGQISKEYDFLPASHTFEISGLCSACRATHPKA